MVDDDAADRAGRDGEEMCPILPGHARLIDELQVGLVNQSRGVQGELGGLGTALSVSDRAQLVVYEGQQAVERMLVAATRFLKQLRDFRGDDRHEPNIDGPALP